MIIRCILIFVLLATSTLAQDSLYTRQVLKTLCSDKYNGRGYVKKGDRKAAQYIAGEYKKAGLISPSANYFQAFRFPVNTFPGEMSITINEKTLKAGGDYIIHPSAPGIKGTYRLASVNRLPSEYKPGQWQGYVLIVDTLGGIEKPSELRKAWKQNPQGAKALFWVEEEKLTWSVSTKIDSICTFRILRKSLPAAEGNISLNCKNRFISSHEAVNVIGMVRGRVQPDSFFVFTAHYDHLGRMGRDNIFPGANDNASGTSMLLNLVRWFSDHPPSCSVLFIACAGEEAGLIGSEYFTKHPWVPLSQMRFLINMDLLGTGDEGMMVVNGEKHSADFDLLDSLNRRGNYIQNLGKRGSAANSDHYHFSEKGVPAFFLFTTGGIKAYHDIYDIEATLPLTRYREAFSLIRDFAESKTKDNL